MSNYKLENRLTLNYTERVREQLEQMKKDGYCLGKDKDGSIYLMQYNVFKNRFTVSASIGEVFHAIGLEKIHNPFKIVLNNVKFIDIVSSVFKVVEMEDLHAYCRYAANDDKAVLMEDYQAQLKDLIKLSKKLGSNADNKKPCTPQEQALALAEKGVIFTGNDSNLKITEIKKYYQWDKKTGLFIKLDAKGIRQIIANYWKLEEKDLNIIDIEKAMRSVYPEMIVTDSFPVYWNTQTRIQAEMKKDKKQYQKIEKDIVRHFQ